MFFTVVKPLDEESLCGDLLGVALMSRDRLDIELHVVASGSVHWFDLGRIEQEDLEL